MSDSNFDPQDPRFPIGRFHAPAVGTAEERAVQILTRNDWHARHHTAHITALRQRRGW